VAILKKDNTEIFSRLLEIAGPKPQEKKLIRQAADPSKPIGWYDFPGISGFWVLFRTLSN